MLIFKVVKWPNPGSWWTAPTTFTGHDRSSLRRTSWQSTRITGGSCQFNNITGKSTHKNSAYSVWCKLDSTKKPDGGVRPIAVGLTLRRLAAKIIRSKLRSFCAEKFRPYQMGVGTPKGCEASVHAVRAYLENENIQDQILLKIDFRNAFNSVRREKYYN